MNTLFRLNHSGLSIFHSHILRAGKARTTQGRNRTFSRKCATTYVRKNESRNQVGELP